MADEPAVRHSSARAGRRRTRLWIGAATVVTVAIFGLGWWAARTFESPAQRAARADPPAAGPLYEKVVQGPLVDEASGPAQVTYSHTHAVLPPSAGDAVVTSRPAARGSTLRPGAAVIAINGRPVLVFAGAFDFYRSLAVRDTGPDVTQLQRGLAAAGLPVSDPAGTFGASTATALKRLYARDGFPAAPGLPLAEVAVAPHLPAVVSMVAAIGTHLSDKPVATLGWGVRVASVTLAASDIVRARLGDHARFIPASGRPAVQTTITALHTANGETAATLSSATGFSAADEGRTGVAIVTLSVVSRRALLVPSRAVAVGHDGVARVLVRSQGSTARAVAVRVLGTLAGRSAIAPVAAGKLRAGDDVRVG